MTGPQIFALFWGVLAFGLGFLFARYPDVVVSLYEKQMSVTKLTRTLQQRHAPRKVVRFWYRGDGIVFMVIGPVVAVLALLGVLH